MLVTRIQAAVQVVLALGTLGWSAPVLLRARPDGQAADPQPRPKAASSATDPASQPPRTDRYGDPLPPGAAMRLGTVRFRPTPSIRRIIYSPDGRFILTGNHQRRLQVWDARNGKNLRQIDVGIEEVRDFVLSPDGNTIAAVGVQYEPERNLVIDYLTVTDAATGRPVRRGEWDGRSNVLKIAYAPDGKTVATVTRDRSLWFWNVGTASVSHQERLVDRYLPSIAFSPDVASHRLAILGDRGIRLWDVAHRRLRSSAMVGCRSWTSRAPACDSRKRRQPWRLSSRPTAGAW